jgi:hypothetical protein
MNINLQLRDFFSLQHLGTGRKEKNSSFLNSFFFVAVLIFAKLLHSNGCRTFVCIAVLA